MPADLNHLTLSGRLARDPVLCVLPSGHTVCDLLVACHYRARDDHSGAWREHTDFVLVRAFGFQARTSCDHLSKGRQVSLVGRICSRRVSENGSDQWVTEMIAQAVQFGERS